MNLYNQSLATYLVSRIGARIPYAIYPILMCFGLGLHGALLSAHVSLQLATYIPVALVLLAITTLERLSPHRKEWTATTPDLRTDVGFLVFVQVLLPKMLTFAASIAIAHLLQDHHLVLTQIWPRGASALGQATLMILMADFFRYWLHVASHRFSLLWKLHSLHHAPKKLHATNVVRFHPLEKSIQYLCDALPFIVLGVSPEVLSLYFVFYAINGFLQHCNIRMKMGLLNYLISGPELHRWHHSENIAESNNNYGNNLIVWDILFGSYFFPKNRDVGALGTGECETDTATGWLSLRAHIEAGVIFIKMLAATLALRLPLIAKTHAPECVQDKLLRKILRVNKNTLFGKDHKFSEISDYELYKRHVPVRRYNDLLPYAEKENGLIPTKAVLFAQTSGTTSDPKYIPVLETDITRYKRNQQILASDIHAQIPGAYSGKLLALVSPAVEGYRSCGTPYGSMSGFLHQNMSKVVKSKYVVPTAIFEITDYQQKYLAIAAHALATSNISFMVTANPSSLLKLADVILKNQDRLINMIDIGDASIDLFPNPKRAIQLRLLLKKVELGASTHLFSCLWPNLKVIATWTAGSCKVILPQLNALCLSSVAVVELGYISSEFRGTINIDVTTNACIPAIDENFYEFVEVNDWEDLDTRPHFNRLRDIKVGKKYYIFVTSQSGLYRYCIDDIVEVDGFYNNTPTLHFVQKGKGITNITGEKLYESQIIDAVDKVLADVNSRTSFEARASDPLKSSTSFFVMVGCKHDLQYTLFIDSNPFDKASQLIESHLKVVNIEFKSKRESGRLKETRVVFLEPGVGDAYKSYCVKKGQREAQFKLMHLQYADALGFNFEGEK